MRSLLATLLVSLAALLIAVGAMVRYILKHPRMRGASPATPPAAENALDAEEISPKDQDQK